MSLVYRVYHEGYPKSAIVCATVARALEEVGKRLGADVHVGLVVRPINRDRVPKHTLIFGDESETLAPAETVGA